MSKSNAVSFYEEIEDETTLSSDISDNIAVNRVKDVSYHNDLNNKKKNTTRRRKKDKTAQKLREIEEKIKEVQLLREKLKPKDPFQPINKKKNEKNNKISSNNSISSATTTKSKKTKSKLNHPHLEIVLGELMYSPYLISPAAKYPNEIYEIPKKLHKIKVSGKEFKDLPLDSIPYNVEEMEFKFREDILKFKPSYFGHRSVKSPSSTYNIDNNSHLDESFHSNDYNSKSSKSNKPRKLPPIKNKKHKRKSTPKDNSSVYTPCSTISDSDESSIYSLFSFNDMEKNYNDWNGVGDRLSSSAGQRRGDNKNNNVAIKVNTNENNNLNALKYDYVDVSLIEKQFESYNNYNENYNNEYYEDDWESWEKEYEKSHDDLNTEPMDIKIIENNTEIEYVSISIPPTTDVKETINQELTINIEEQQNINEEQHDNNIEHQDIIDNIVGAVEKRNVVSATTRRTTELLIDEILSNSLHRLSSR